MNPQQHALLLSARHWMQSALEELFLCPNAHRCVLLADGRQLLDQVDALLRSKVRLEASSPAENATLRRRLDELDGALAVVAKALLSPEALVRAAQAIEGKATSARPTETKREHCECLDWTQVGYPISAYWPDLHPNYHHPDCEKYVPPPRTNP